MPHIGWGSRPGPDDPARAAARVARQRMLRVTEAMDPTQGTSAMVRIVFNRLLGGWFVVREPHQTPLSGKFETKADAQAWLNRGK